MSVEWSVSRSSIPRSSITALLQMPSFTYRAIKGSGESISGTLEADDRRQVLRKLQSMQARPISISEQKMTGASKTAKQASSAEEGNIEAGSASRGFRIPLPSFKSKDTIGLNFLKRLLDLHSSGMPLGDSVRLLQMRLSDPQLRSLAHDLWKELSEGRPLAEGMRTLPEYFDDSITHVIEAGEATGSLVPILERIVDHLEEKQSIRAQVMGGLAYPMFLVTAATGVALFLVFYLLPRIRGMLDALGGDINWSMAILINGSAFLLNFGPILLACLVLGLIGFTQWRKTAKGRIVTDKWIIRIPLLGRIFYFSDLFQLSSLIGTLTGSGVNMTETLRLTEKTIRNQHLRGQFRTARIQVNEGASVSQALKINKLMPELSIDILSVGENTGNIVNSLNEIGKSFRKELDLRLKVLITTVTSGALVCAFLLVALVAYGMVSSVFQVSRTLSIG